MDKALFFQVWDLPELRGLIKSYMFPYKRTANYYNYRNEDIAAIYGYFSLFKEHRLAITYSTLEYAALNGHLEMVQWMYANSDVRDTGVMDYAAASGHIEIVRWFHYNSTERCTTDAMDYAAGCGHLDMVMWLHINRIEGCTTKAMDLAAANNYMDVIEWLNINRTEGCTQYALEAAFAEGRVEIANWIIEHYPQFRLAEVLRKIVDRSAH